MKLESSLGSRKNLSFKRGTLKIDEQKNDEENPCMISKSVQGNTSSTTKSKFAAH